MHSTPPVPDASAPWMTAEEAAEHARVAYTTIIRASRRKTLRSVKVGRTYRFRPDWVDDWLIAGAA